jgi:hypothetical protein
MGIVITTRVEELFSVAIRAWYNAVELLLPGGIPSNAKIELYMLLADDSVYTKPSVNASVYIPGLGTATTQVKNAEYVLAGSLEKLKLLEFIKLSVPF